MYIPPVGKPRKIRLLKDEKDKLSGTEEIEEQEK
jgi:hypothetical protein